MDIRPEASRLFFVLHGLLLFEPSSSFSLIFRTYLLLICCSWLEVFFSFAVTGCVFVGGILICTLLSEFLLYPLEIVIHRIRRFVANDDIFSLAGSKALVSCFLAFVDPSEEVLVFWVPSLLPQ